MVNFALTPDENLSNHLGGINGNGIDQDDPFNLTSNSLQQLGGGVQGSQANRF